MCLIPILGSCNRSLYRDRFSDDPLFGGGGGGIGGGRIGGEGRRRQGTSWHSSAKGRLTSRATDVNLSSRHCSSLVRH